MGGLSKCVMCPGSDEEQLHSECTGDSQAPLVNAALIFPVQSKLPGDIPEPLETGPVSSHSWSCSLLMWMFLRSRRNDSSSPAKNNIQPLYSLIFQRDIVLDKQICTYEWNRRLYYLVFQPECNLYNGKQSFRYTTSLRHENLLAVNKKIICHIR